MTVIRIQQTNRIIRLSSVFGKGEVNTASNVGSGAGVFRDKTLFNLNLRSITSTGTATATQNVDEIEIGVQPKKDEFVPTSGQTVFSLAAAPIDPNSVQVEINGVVADDVTDFGVSASTLTWLDTEHTLDGSDKLIVRYH